ncbi:MAG: 3-deoxy-manno-octulosonate cytidylyltransferase [Candidatus Dojkabacteria bacterium]|nr:3-deoxy-manno-octulosonate cytidylyltransferase [Candidatus Dojkabacteria bacterium]
MPKSCIIIPARLGSTRLPKKLMLPVRDKPLLYYTWKKAVEADIGDVYIAAVDEEIVEEMMKFNAKSYKVPNNLNSGTDAIHYCYNKYLSGKYDYIINLQGDTPTIPIEYIKYVTEPLEFYDIGTLCFTTDFEEATKNQVVKVVLAKNRTNVNVYNALYFSRSAIPYNSTEYYHHVGIYSFTEASLNAFCDCEISILEKTEKLEQLRALENNISIGVRIVDRKNIYGIDTAEDYEKFLKEIN